MQRRWVILVDANAGREQPVVACPRGQPRGAQLSLKPYFVERDDNFFDCLVNPYITDQEIYKYTTPPHARPRYAPGQNKGAELRGARSAPEDPAVGKQQARPC